MGCGSCSNNNGSGTPAGCNNNGACGNRGCGKLNVFDWLAGLERGAGTKPFNVVEVRFKNTRKEYFRAPDNLDLSSGEVVAVESTSGHDIGVVSLTGELVKMQLAKRKIPQESKELKKIYRKAGQADIDKWIESRDLENSTMLATRIISTELKLDMKISDVEFQGDGTKATFFYTADDRVDFRELIKVLADRFKVRIEMRQIGARQEAGRLGGIGSCGRELCCSTWLTDFRSVSTSAARYQQLSINPIKLAGQCGKLKCCLNYELDAYLDEMKDFPGNDVRLKTEKGPARHQKTDIFRRTMWFTHDSEPDKFIPLSVERVNEIIAKNKKGEKVQDLKEFQIRAEPVVKEPDYENVVGQDSLTRFDNKGNKGNRNNKNRNKRRKGKNPSQAQGQAKGPAQAQGPSRSQQSKPKPRAKNQNREQQKGKK